MAQAGNSQVGEATARAMQDVLDEFAASAMGNAQIRPEDVPFMTFAQQAVDNLDEDEMVLIDNILGACDA